MNRYGLEFFGYTQEELIGKNDRDHIIAEVV
jgi:PAS domain-containing protein